MLILFSNENAEGALLLYLCLYLRHFYLHDKVTAIFSAWLINANASQYTNLLRERVEIIWRVWQTCLKLYAKALETKRIEACLIGSIKGQSIRDVSYYFISGRFSSFTKLSCYFRYYFCAWWKAKLNVYEAWGYNRCTYDSCYAIYAACVVKVQKLSSDRGISSNEK